MKSQLLLLYSLYIVSHFYTLSKKKPKGLVITTHCLRASRVLCHLWRSVAYTDIASYISSQQATTAIAPSQNKLYYTIARQPVLWAWICLGGEKKTQQSNFGKGDIHQYSPNYVISIFTIDPVRTICQLLTYNPAVPVAININYPIFSIVASLLRLYFFFFLAYRAAVQYSPAQ